jgi:hypothetical protein
VLGYEKGSKAESESAGVAGTDVQPSGVVAGSALADAVAAYVLVKVSRVMSDGMQLVDTQALLPVRIAVSVGAAPAFARFALNPVQRAWRKLRRTA